ncbi:MAG: nucleotidyltransferase domain-containing protein [Deltaproteobacteria bacterium]
MKPLRVTRKLLGPEFQKAEIIRITKVISSAVNPQAIYCFGSASEGKATDQSDFDFLIVLDDSASIQKERLNLRPHLPISTFPVDIIWKKKSEFIKQREVGGVSLVAFEDGICTYSKDLNEFPLHHKL